MVFPILKNVKLDIGKLYRKNRNIASGVHNALRYTLPMQEFLHRNSFPGARGYFHSLKLQAALRLQSL